MALVIDNISKRFGATAALDGVSFAVEPGRIFGFLGANGAGKTTTMRIVLDILRADTGRVTWFGRANTDVPRRTWGYLPEERGLYARMRVMDQLVFFAALYGVSRADATRRATVWLERFRIPEYAARRAEELSKGNQQKIQFIAATIHDPDVLLMDEPFSGLDPLNMAMLKEAFLEMARQGKTLIFSTHQMETVEELCESIVIVDRGRLIVGGPILDVKRASGRQLVRLALDDDPQLAWLPELRGIRLVRHGRDYVELEVERGHDPAIVLREAMARGGRVRRFEIVDPSLEEIFIERVGASPTSDEVHLAGASSGAFVEGAGIRP